MKNKLISILLCVLLCFTGTLQLFFLTAEAIDYAYSVEISVPETIYADDVTKVTLTLNTITTPLSGVEFVLAFDKNYLTPVITQNANNEMNAFMVKTPPNGWEQACRYNAEDATYTLRFVSDNGGTDDVDLIKTAADLVIEIPFIVNKAGGFNLTVKNSNIMGFGIDPKIIYTGQGCTLAATAIDNLFRYSVDLSAPETVPQSSRTNLTVTITNNTDTSGLIAIEFKLYFGNSCVPVLKSNDSGQMSTFLTSSPNSNWEQICSLNETYNYYLIRIAAKNTGSIDKEILYPNDTITLTIPFAIKGELNSTSLFYIPSESCIAVNSITKTVTGQGDNASFTVIQGTSIGLDPTGSLIQIESGNVKYVSGIDTDTSVSELRTQFLNDGLVIKNADGVTVTDDICTTGYTVCFYNGDVLLDSVTLVVKGDINGDGEISAIDYIFVKRAFIGTITLNETQLQAAYIKDSTKITSSAYLMIKRHVFGTYNIFA